MSLGGDFYALTDLQLERMLEGALGLEFLYDELEEKPRECYSEAEHAWYELMQILSPVMMPFSEQTDTIPEMSQFSWAHEVVELAEELVEIDDEMIEERYDPEEMNTDLDTLKGYIKKIVSFYQRAAQHGDAVLFRVT